MFRVIVAGTRSFSNYPFIASKLDRLLVRRADAMILTGDAPGVDACAARYARERRLSFEIYEADWDMGEQAGPIRNATMASEADALVAFWDGKSRGTADMISKAKGYGLEVRVIRIIT